MAKKNSPKKMEENEEDDADQMDMLDLLNLRTDHKGNPYVYVPTEGGSSWLNGIKLPSP